MSLTCYRIRNSIGASRLTDPEQALDLDEKDVLRYGPVDGPDFRAWLYVVQSFPHEPRWGPFLRSGFDDVQLPTSASPAAVLLVSTSKKRFDLYAFTFGIGGRFLLRDEAYERGYGLRAALNVLYPATAPAGQARLRATETKRRGATLLRARVQASEVSEFETFGVNQLLDVMNSASGVPVDRDVWGSRIGGADLLAFAGEIDFSDLGRLCRQISETAERKDYQQEFGWIDNMQPVSDAWTRQRLEREVIERIVDGRLDDFSLAPPEIIDWHRVVGFRYPFDRQNKRGRSGPVLHPDVRIDDFRRGVNRAGHLDDLGIAYLLRARISVVEHDGAEVGSWPCWKWLVGQIGLGDNTYVLDEGEFFLVNRDYLAELDTFTDAIPRGSVVLPTPRLKMKEGDYNALAAHDDAVVSMDMKTVKITTRTTPVEVCDLLTRNRQLVHVKRHFGSSDLSHLFAQGAVSAELLQASAEFRGRAQAKLNEAAGEKAGFSFLAASPFNTADFEVVYAIIERWNARKPSEALPFFSKINLRLAVENLRSRSYRVALQPLDAAA
jgi:uncharacterized protein (TIGR04141 family)